MTTANTHTPARASFTHRRLLRRLAAPAATLLLAGGLLASPGTPGASAATTAGSLDTTFGTNGVAITDVGANTDDDGADVVVQPDGKIVVVGTSNDDILVVRYLPDGRLDTSFSGDGVVTTDVNGVDVGTGVALQPDGKIVVAGSAGDVAAFAVLRYTPSGALDTSFDTDGIQTETFGTDASAAFDVAVTSAGIVVVGGTGAEDATDFALARYTSAGALDPTFSADGKVTTPFNLNQPNVALALAVQPDGKLVVAGGTGVGADPSDFAVARYTTAGDLDNTFGGVGIVSTKLGAGSDAAVAVALTADGKIVAGGSSGSGDSALVRYTPGGGLDTSFDADGKVTTDWGSDSLITGVAVQPDGRIVTSGLDLAATGDFLVGRYNTDGSLDQRFDGDGKVRSNFGGDTQAIALALQPDGKILVAGLLQTATDAEVAVARYLGASTGPTAPLGYRMVAADGGIFTFGERSFRGSTGDLTLNKPIVGGATNPATVDGYWIVASDGGVFSFGDVGFYGSLANTPLDSPVAEIEPTPSGKGYWMVTAKGRVYPFGDATAFGDASALNLNQPIVGMTTTSTGKGYWLLGADGGIFSYGDALFFGSTGNLRLNAPVVDIAGLPNDDGYFLVAGDGGVFTFGAAEFKGSTGDIRLNQPVNSMLVTPDGKGYWLAASDGGVFTFGSATFLGSMGAVRLNAPVLDMIL